MRIISPSSREPGGNGGYDGGGGVGGGLGGGGDGGGGEGDGVWEGCRRGADRPARRRLPPRRKHACRRLLLSLVVDHDLLDNAIHNCDNLQLLMLPIMHQTRVF